MKFNKDWLNKNWGALTITACAGVVLFVILWNLPGIASALGRFLYLFRPVFIGIVIAYVLTPLVKIFETRVFVRMHLPGARRALAVLCTVIAVIFLLVLLGFFVIPQLVASVSGFIGNLGRYTRSLQDLLHRVSEFLAQKNIDAEEFVHATENFLNVLQDALPSSVQEILSLLGNIGSHLLDYILAAIMAVYFLSDKERILTFLKRIFRALLKPSRYAGLMDFARRGHSILIRYILFSLLDSLIIGLANFIFMVIADLPYGAMISVVVGLTNLAPTFGPVIGAAIGAFILLLVNPWYALYFLIFTVIIQIIDGYILKPRLFGGALGVPGVVVLICIIIGGRLFGIWGVLLAIPFAAIASFLVKEALERREAKRAAEYTAGSPAKTTDDT